MEEDKKPKVIVVGMGHHEIGAETARRLAETHQVEIISPDEARAMSVVAGEMPPMVLPYNAPPIPILEKPFVIRDNSSDFIPKSGREKRKDERKKKKRKKRRY